MKVVIPSKCIVDTNVPIIANSRPDVIPPGIALEDVSICINAIQSVIESKGLILDRIIGIGSKICEQYRTHLNQSGQPGVGDKFMKWVFQEMWNFPPDQIVEITPEGNSYREYPNNKGLKQLDPSDKVFVAVANAHPEKPPILQASDSPWLRWKDSLKEEGITVIFLCREFVESVENNCPVAPR